MLELGNKLTFQLPEGHIAVIAVCAVETVDEKGVRHMNALRWGDPAIWAVAGLTAVLNERMQDKMRAAWDG